VSIEIACSVIIPCFNEEGAIAETITEVASILKESHAFEIVVVDDGSTDRSRDILKELEAGMPQLRAILHNTNKGYGAALKSGIRRARYDHIVITDADGTYPNHRIPDLLEKAHDADMVVGSRTAPEGVEYPFIRKIPKFFLKKYAEWLSGQPIADMNSGLRVLKKPLVERFLPVLPDGFSFTTTITLAILTNYYHVKYEPITYSSRVGKSKIRPIKDTLNFVQLIVRTGMYFAPLRVFFPIIMLLGLGFAISASYDLFVLRDMTEKTLILLMFTLNTAFFALLADMLDKRTASK
jgi:glycosyltransferase involved in cell wall biosynthesis